MAQRATAEESGNNPPPPFIHPSFSSSNPPKKKAAAAISNPPQFLLSGWLWGVAISLIYDNLMYSRQKRRKAGGCVEGEGDLFDSD